MGGLIAALHSGHHPVKKPMLSHDGELFLRLFTPRERKNHPTPPESPDSVVLTKQSVGRPISAQCFGRSVTLPHSSNTLGHLRNSFMLNRMNDDRTPSLDTSEMHLRRLTENLGERVHVLCESKHRNLGRGVSIDLESILLTSFARLCRLTGHDQSRSEFLWAQIDARPKPRRSATYQCQLYGLAYNGSMTRYTKLIPRHPTAHPMRSTAVGALTSALRCTAS